MYIIHKMYISEVTLASSEGDELVKDVLLSTYKQTLDDE